MFRLARLLALRKVPERLQGYERALALIEIGGYDEAYALLRELLEHPETPSRRAEYYNKRGVVLANLDRREEARSDFESALKLAPHHARALVNLGNLLLEAGDASAAARQYEAAIARDPQCASAYHNLGVAQKRLGLQDAAVRNLRQATKLDMRSRNPFRRRER